MALDRGLILFSQWNNRCDSTFSGKHGFSVKPDDQSSNNHEHPGIIRLSIRPQGIDQLKVEKRGEQDTATRIVEERCHDDAQGYGA